MAEKPPLESFVNKPEKEPVEPTQKEEGDSVVQFLRGKPGKTPSKQELTELIKPLIPKVEKPSKEELLDIIVPLIPYVEDGKTPSDEDLTNLIKPLIPKVKDGKTPSTKELLSLIQPLIPEVKDGVTPSKEELTSLIKPLIPEMAPADTGDQIVTKINKSKGVIKRSRLEGFDEVESIARTAQKQVQNFTSLGGSRQTAIKVSGTLLGTGITTINFVGATGAKVGDGSEVSITTSGSGSGVVQTIVAGTGISVDSTDPANPIVSASGGGSGTVTSVASADGSITVTNPTTTVDLAVVKAPKWTTARNLAGNSVDGSTNVPFANKFIVQGTTDAGLSGAQFLGALGTGIVKNTTTTGVLSIATSGTDYEVPLTFSTGLTRSTNTVTVNTSQNIATLSNLTSNGLVTTSGSVGTLSVTVPGTGVLTALGVNVGSAGAFVTFNGALGTPSSGTATNLTGTAAGLTAGAATALATARTIGTVTGDATSTGSTFDGSANNTNALTLATVNGNVGSFTSANITVNAKGLITAASNGSGGTGITWTEVTGTTQTAAINNGYILNNAGLVTLTLPSTAAVGSIVEAAGKGAGGWKIAQNASGIIHYGNVDTTTGTGGSLASVNRYDSIRLVCIVANNEWVVLSSQGNITTV